MHHRRKAGQWAERTPSRLIFNTKAYGAVTYYPMAVERLAQTVRVLLLASVAAK
jgi:uncharacterized protein YecE (DUF72 family)